MFEEIVIKVLPEFCLLKPVSKHQLFWFGITSDKHFIHYREGLRVKEKQFDTYC